jgi:hypothetical protein
MRFQKLVWPLLLTIFSQSLQAQEAPSRFRILDIRSAGSGCPEGSVATNISDDQEAFTLSFNSFFAEIGPDVARDERRKSCRMSFVTQHEPGWEFAVVGITQRGAVSLEEGVHAKQSMRYGLPLRHQIQSTFFRGPIDQDYSQNYRVAFSDLQWTGCKRRPWGGQVYSLQSSIELGSRSADARGLFTVDSIDGEVKQVFDIVWRRCEARLNRFVAVCTLNAGDPAMPQLLAKAQGLRPYMALDKARRKLEQRCEELSGSQTSCDMAEARCEIQSMRL